MLEKVGEIILKKKITSQNASPAGLVDINERFEFASRQNRLQVSRTARLLQGQNFVVHR